MRFTSSSQRGLLMLSLATMLGLAACSTSSVPAASTTSAASSTATSAPAAVTASTSLCNLMSFAQLGATLGGTVTTLNSNITAAGTERSVNCSYFGTAAHVHAEVSYLFSANGPTSYAADQKDVAGRGEQITNLSGLGDSAFWAVSPSIPYTLQLTALKGNILIIMTMTGANANGNTMVNGTIGLARAALPGV